MTSVYRLLAHIFIGICFFIASDVRAQETIRVASGEWPPYISESFKFGGFVTRVCTEAFALAGFKPEYEYMPWKRAYHSTQLGDFAASPGWRKTPERERYFYFSEPIFNSRTVFFHRKDFPFDWTILDDVRDRTIGITLGYSLVPLLEPIVDQGKGKLDIAPTDENNLLKLASGRIDLFPCSEAVGYYLLRAKLLPGTADTITHHPTPLMQGPAYLIVSRKSPKAREIIARFNKGLQKLRESGRYDQYQMESLKGEYLPEK